MMSGIAWPKALNGTLAKSASPSPYFTQPSPSSNREQPVFSQTMLCNLLANTHHKLHHLENFKTLFSLFLSEKGKRGLQQAHLRLCLERLRLLGSVEIVDVQEIFSTSA